MDLKNLDVFSAATKNMGYLSARQQVLAENVANANTPNYLARDVAKPSFEKELKAQIALNATNPKHFTAPRNNIGMNRVYTPAPKEALSIDGNGVDIEYQMNEVSKTRGDYNQMLSIYNKYKAMIQVANKTTGV